MRKIAVVMWPVADILARKQYHELSDFFASYDRIIVSARDDGCGVEGERTQLEVLEQALDGFDVEKQVAYTTIGSYMTSLERTTPDDELTFFGTADHRNRMEACEALLSNGGNRVQNFIYLRTGEKQMAWVADWALAKAYCAAETLVPGALRMLAKDSRLH